MKKGFPPKLKKIGKKKRITTYDGKTLFRQEIYFKDYPEFRPNLTPKQVIQMGSFGGSYFRDLEELQQKNKDKSSNCKKTGRILKNIHKRYRFFNDIPDKLLKTPWNKRDIQLNKYKTHSGSSYEYWCQRKWIRKDSELGWFHWYCSFYAARSRDSTFMKKHYQTEDDEINKYQIQRWLGVSGPKGRWYRFLQNKVKLGKDSPKVRQLHQHWALDTSEI